LGGGPRNSTGIKNHKSVIDELVMGEGSGGGKQRLTGKEGA